MTPSRFSRPSGRSARRYGVTMLCALSVSGLLLTSCAGNLVSIKPPVTIAPRMQNSPDFKAWVTGLVDGYVRNCITLQTMRSEDVSACTQP